MMQTREAPDFGGLHKKANCAFPLTTVKAKLAKGLLKIRNFVELFLVDT